MIHLLPAIDVETRSWTTLFFFQSPDVLGLVIEKANYGCSLDEAKDLVIDATTAVQALVNKSQLYIPGRQTKVNSFWMSDCRKTDGLCATRLGWSPGLLRPGAELA